MADSWSCGDVSIGAELRELNRRVPGQEMEKNSVIYCVFSLDKINISAEKEFNEGHTCSSCRA